MIFRVLKKSKENNLKEYNDLDSVLTEALHLIQKHNHGFGKGTLELILEDYYLDEDDDGQEIEATSSLRVEIVKTDKDSYTIESIMKSQQNLMNNIIVELLDEKEEKE